jgi:hypothetical protein
MSEFSESYHLKSTIQEDGVMLLKKAGLSGYVLPNTRGNWVTIVVKDSNFEPIRSLIDVNEGELLHHIYAEDHGWLMSVYNSNKHVFEYECDWEDEIFINDKNLDFDVLSNLVKPSVLDMNELKEIFYPKDFDSIFENPPAYRIAEILGIEHYGWVSFDYVHNIVQEHELDLPINIDEIIYIR